MRVLSGISLTVQDPDDKTNTPDLVASDPLHRAPGFELRRTIRGPPCGDGSRYEKG